MNPAVIGGMRILYILAIAAIGIGYVYLWYRILQRMGYSGWLGLLMVISPVNAILLIYLAFAKWPIHSDIERYERSIPAAAKEEAAKGMLEEADRLRSEFKFEDARSIYRAILRLYPNTDAGRAADKALTEIRMDELQRP